MFRDLLPQFNILHIQIGVPLAAGLLFTAYVAYYLFFHPLAGFPGPTLAALSNTWKTYHVLRLDLHEAILKLHNIHGPVVRVGPNDLHIWDAKAVPAIYKAGRSMPKTEFYNAFTAFKPNMFGTTDEDRHAVRRRQLSNGFSMSSVRGLEPIMDRQLGILRERLESVASNQEVFDLKEFMSSCMLDGLGEMAFARSFHAQKRSDPIEITAIHDHILLSCLTGQLPLQRVTKFFIAWSPIPRVRRLVKSRAMLMRRCEECVEYRTHNEQPHKDLLGGIIKATDPETGASLSKVEVDAEAFALLVAGSHSTSGTLSMLFYNILKNPQVLQAIVQEIDDNLPRLLSDRVAHSFDGLERLAYVSACIRENFRRDPVFNMTLWRRVDNPDGLVINGNFIPHKTNVCVMNYVLHHNPDIWGLDHDKYDPSRWLKDSSQQSRHLLPFSTGHRACIGRNIATVELYKVLTTLLGEYEFSLCHPEKEQRLESSGIGELGGKLLCTVRIREQPLGKDCS